MVSKVEPREGARLKGWIAACNVATSCAVGAAAWLAAHERLIGCSSGVISPHRVRVGEWVSRVESVAHCRYV